MKQIRAMVLHPEVMQPEEANEYARAFAMIETAEAIKNVEEILDVDGLDGIFVGEMLTGCPTKFNPCPLKAPLTSRYPWG